MNFFYFFLLLIVIVLIIYRLVFIFKKEVFFVSRKKLKKISEIHGYEEEIKIENFLKKIIVISLYVFSVPSFVCNTSPHINPFKVWCFKCKNDNSRLSSTHSESGYFNFLGIISWGWYEAVICFCGEPLMCLVIF